MTSTRVMGIVNVTPDSFSDGGRFFNPADAVDHARQLLDEGADILDVGGESSRPGADAITELEELRRVIPVIEAIRAFSPVPISVDTVKSKVAQAAVLAGAVMWNDVAALSHDQDSLETAARLGCDVVLTHRQGTAKTMQNEPHYEDVVTEVAHFLRVRAEAAITAGVLASRILIDPGLGFGKTAAHNLALLAHLDHFAAQDFRVVLGASRKRFLQVLDPLGAEASDRLGGSLAAAMHAARTGCAIVRVHDVRQTVQALKLQTAIAAAR